MKTTKVICYFLIFVLISLRCASGQMNDATISDFETYFQDVAVDSHGFISHRNQNGGRMSFKIGEQDIQLCEPGALVKVPFGQSFELFEKHSGIRFDSLSAGNRAFIVTKYFNASSFGGEMQKKEAVALIENKSKDAVVKMIPFSNPEARSLLTHQ